MNEFFLESATLGVVLSLAGYFIGTAVKKKWKLPILNPLLIAIVLVVTFLAVFKVDYDAYNSSAKYLSYLLTPATVSLSGVLTSLVSVLALAVLFRLTHEEYVTLLPKSITTAIGMGVSEELGGYAVITTAVIIITGVFGNMAAETLCRVFRIRHSISRGLAIGTASHAVGTAKAMEMGKIEGAMSSLAIVVSGLCTVAGAVAFASFL